MKLGDDNTFSVVVEFFYDFLQTKRLENGFSNTEITFECVCESSDNTMIKTLIKQSPIIQKNEGKIEKRREDREEKIEKRREDREEKIEKRREEKIEKRREDREEKRRSDGFIVFNEEERGGRKRRVKGKGRSVHVVKDGKTEMTNERKGVGSDVLGGDFEL